MLWNITWVLVGLIECFFHLFSVRQIVSFLNWEEDVFVFYLIMSCFWKMHYIFRVIYELRRALRNWQELICSSSVKERTSVSTGLVGCIRMLDVNNLFYNLQENGDNVLYGSGVGECGNNPCMPNPCKNGASCQVKEAEMFHCKCVNGFSGKCTFWL